ncbi:class I SAM-dependent methyltransferase [Luteimonas sp. FCS-9]|uniref:class I SAM-dependent methyltransferase n=1 Tax=Luteimonas sp. FCS-9 TaxID=1547516 RepID=UPI00063E6F01|nr:class I SAM-dependent methyltransferase [Luteimonas sp. FCS-9]KLJ00765.1 methyltransferase [Luteimonas sp. FCS-9]
MQPVPTSQKLIPTWYVDPADEQHMAEGHAPIWRHIVALMPEGDLSTRTVLDFGCNQGGFLRQLHALRPFSRALGVDIAEQSVQRAEALKGALPVQHTTDVGLAGWTDHFDLAFSHEVIYLIEDIQAHARTLFDVLRPGGVYYAITGCHTDNPQWPRWRQIVAERTHTDVQDRSVSDYAQAFERAGFAVTARLFEYPGFVPYAPDGWSPDFYQALAYYTRSKVMFRLVKR